jgi:Oxidoreductase family, C-terminal alpha/beta domain
MLAAARKHGRVVQVERSAAARRTWPRHVITSFARDGSAKSWAAPWLICRTSPSPVCGTQPPLVEIYCCYHMRAESNPPDTQPPENLDYEMWTGPAPLRPYNRLVHPRSWRAFMEYGNGTAPVIARSSSF